MTVTIERIGPIPADIKREAARIEAEIKICTVFGLPPDVIAGMVRAALIRRGLVQDEASNDE